MPGTTQHRLALAAMSAWHTKLNRAEKQFGTCVPVTPGVTAFGCDAISAVQYLPDLQYGSALPSSSWLPRLPEHQVISISICAQNCVACAPPYMAFVA